MEDVSLDIGGNSILSDINIAFASGVTCVLGPNGAGKTMTNRLLGLLQQVSTGRIRWDDRIVNPFQDQRLRHIREVGFMHQQPVFVKKTVWENIHLPLRFRRDPDGKEKTDNIISEFELEDLSDSYIENLSVGQRQRVALARTLVTDPQIIILDEPTASLDMRTTKWFEERISILNEQERRIIVWTTHDHFQAKRVADKLAVILQGRIRSSGDVKDVFGNSEDRDVTRYLSGELIT